MKTKRVKAIKAYAVSSKGARIGICFQGSLKHPATLTIFERREEAESAAKQYNDGRRIYFVVEVSITIKKKICK